MKINSVAWAELKEDIEKQLQNDINITDITINYQARESTDRNYLQYNIKIK
jgi:hypothetical protein